MAELARVSVDIRVHADSDFRATEIVADLRNIAETLFFPMKCVGFWDIPTKGHICPQLQRGHECPHRDGSAPEVPDGYRDTVENELGGVLEVAFPHAGVYIYLG